MASSNHTRVPSRSGQRLPEAAAWDSRGGILHAADKVLAGVFASAADTGKCRWRRGEGKANRPDTHTLPGARAGGKEREPGEMAGDGGAAGTPQHPT